MLLEKEEENNRLSLASKDKSKRMKESAVPILPPNTHYHAVPLLR